MEHYYKSNPSRTGYRKRLHASWLDTEDTEFSEQRLVDQARSILNNNLLSDLQLLDLRAPLAFNSPSTSHTATPRPRSGTLSTTPPSPPRRDSRPAPPPHIPSTTPPAPAHTQPSPHHPLPGSVTSLDMEPESDTAPESSAQGSAPEPTPPRYDPAQRPPLPPSNRNKKRRRVQGTRKKWTTEENVRLMEHYHRSNPDNKGFRKRLHASWIATEDSDCSEQKLAAQVNSILKNGLLSDVQLLEIRTASSHSHTTDGTPLVEFDIIDLSSTGPSSTPPAPQTPDPTLPTPFSSTIPPSAPDVDIGDWPGSQPPDFDHTLPDPTPGPVTQTIRQLRRDAEGNPPSPPGTPLTPPHPATSTTSATPSPEQQSYRTQILNLLEDPSKIQVKILRHVNRKKLLKTTKEMNAVIATIPTENITETNTLLMAAAHVVRETLGEKPYPAVPRKKTEPKWKRRVEEKIVQDRKDISHLEEMKKGKKLKTKITDGLNRRHPLLKKKGLSCIAEELKQRLRAKAAKIKRFQKRTENFHHNRMFTTNQRQFYRNLNAATPHSPAPPAADKDACLKFWKDIWDDPVSHNGEAEWIEGIKTTLSDCQQQNPLTINSSTVTNRAKKMANWSTAGTDGLHVYWIKHLDAAHDRIAAQLMECVATSTVPQWMTEGRTHLLIKDQSKGPLPSNLRPITCLPAMWKLFTGMLSDSIYSHLKDQQLFPSEQKGCKRKSRGCKEQLLIDKMILKNCKRRHTNLSMAYIDYRKAYDKIPHSWIIESMTMCGVAPEIVSLFRASLDPRVLFTLDSVVKHSAPSRLSEASSKEILYRHSSL